MALFKDKKDKKDKVIGEEQPETIPSPVEAAVEATSEAGGKVQQEAEIDPALAAVPREFTPPSPTEVAQMVARIRNRGTTNPMFDGVAKAFDDTHPGWKSMWEFSPPDSRQQQAVMERANTGFRIVYAEEMPDGTPMPHTARGGPVRVADMVLMAAPDDVYYAIRVENARQASEEAQLPVKEYEASLLEKGRVGGQEGVVVGQDQTGQQTQELDLSLGKLDRVHTQEG